MPGYAKLTSWFRLLEKSCLLLLGLLPLLWYRYDHSNQIPLLPYLYFAMMTLASNVIGRQQGSCKGAFWPWLQQLLVLCLLLLLGELYLLPLNIEQRLALWLGAANVVISLVLTGRLLLAWRCQASSAANTQATEPAAWLIGFASQSGVAEQLARRSAKQLSASGMAVQVLSLNQLQPDSLSRYQGALFVVSTYGEGEAPDNALLFHRAALLWQQQLAALPFAVLALGDRSYQQFCAFGHWLHQWCSARQAKALSDVIEIDSQQATKEPLQQWQQLLTRLSGPATPAMSLNADSTRWQHSQLVSRYLSNPGSKGAPCYILKLAVPADSSWQAGDIVAIQPENSKCAVALWLTRHQLYGCQQVQYQGQRMPLCCALASLSLADVSAPAAGQCLQQWLAQQPLLPQRCYSIASLPTEGYISLLVRQVSRADGSLGIGSGWLTSWLCEQQPLKLQLRQQTHFQLPQQDRPVLFIANGTGIASIRAMLAERVARGQYQNWLIFGERNQQTDFFFAKDIQHWQQQGFIADCQLVFSRDQPQKRYVQHALAAKATALQQLVRAGGAIYVCGSLQGMGREVHQVLIAHVGEEMLLQLQQQGRYQRDLY